MSGEMYLALGCGAALVLMGVIAYRAVTADYVVAERDEQDDKNIEP
jgi:hypothetical protein